MRRSVQRLRIVTYALPARVQEDDGRQGITGPAKWNSWPGDDAYFTRTRPPFNRLPHLQIDDPAFLEKTFWQMIFTGLEWFPSEKWFVEVGLENAVFSGNAEMRKRLLEIGAERFYSDIHFLREMYYYNLENRDAGGAAGVVNQLIKQYPDELEPIYLGLKLSLLTTKKITLPEFPETGSCQIHAGAYHRTAGFCIRPAQPGTAGCHHPVADFETDYPHLRYYATISGT